MLEVQTEAFMLGPAAKSSGWNPLPLQITAFITSEKSLAWKEKDGGENEWKQYLVKNGVTRARGTLSVQMCGRERYLNVVFFFHVWREEEREADKEGRGWRKTKQEKWHTWRRRGRKESKMVGGWNGFSLNETFFISLHNMSPHLGHQVSFIHRPLSNAGLFFFFPPLNLCRFYFLQ